MPNKEKSLREIIYAVALGQIGNPDAAVKEIMQLFDKPATPGQAGELSHDRVNIPVHEDEAAMMVLLGTDWLEKNAPHRLRKPQSGSPSMTEMETVQPITPARELPLIDKLEKLYMPDNIGINPQSVVDHNMAVVQAIAIARLLNWHRRLPIENIGIRPLKCLNWCLKPMALSFTVYGHSSRARDWKITGLILQRHAATLTPSCHGKKVTAKHIQPNISRFKLLVADAITTEDNIGFYER